MKLYLVNKNPIITKLVSLSVSKINLDMVETQEIDSTLQADILLLDDECYTKETYEQYKQENSGVKTILFYAKSTERVEGFDEYVQKPFLPTELVRVLSEVSGMQPLDNVVGVANDIQNDEAVDEIETLQELPNIYTVTIVCRPGQGGTVLGAGNYEVNDYAYLEAFPNPGYKFVRWYSGKVLSTHETCEVVVKDDMTVNAIFEEISANENDLANAIGLAPNPVSDVLNVSAPFAIEKIFVYDYQGRAIQVFEGKGQTEMTLDLESLAQGNYILNIQTLQGNVQKKIVKL